MKHVELKDLVYTVQDVRSPFTQTSDQKLTQSAYELWTGVWREVFGGVGQQNALDPDDFFRQDLLCAITGPNGEPVAMHLYTFFDLASGLERYHSYFGDLGDHGVARFRQIKCLRVMSMEYLTVNAEWRKSKTGYAFGDALIGLGLKVMDASGFDAAIGTPRADVGVDKASAALGCKLMQQNINRYDLVCSLMICKNGEHNRHPDEKTAQLIDYLWANRIDHSNVTTEKQTASQKKAA